MYLSLGINLLGLLVFIGIATAFSKKRKEISWKTVGVLALFNLFLAWFLTSFFVGRNIVLFLAAGFQWIVDVSYTSIAFAFPDWVHVERMNFFTGALLPILMIVPLFDILSYIGVILSAFKGFIDEDRIYLIPKNVGYMMLSGILVSLLSAAFAGLFIWCLPIYAVFSTENRMREN